MTSSFEITSQGPLAVRGPVVGVMVGEGRIKGVGGIGVAEEMGNIFVDSTVFVGVTVLVDWVVATAVMFLSPSCVGVVIRGCAVQDGKKRTIAKSNQSFGFILFAILKIENISAPEAINVITFEVGRFGNHLEVVSVI